jgi:flagellar protein FlbD
MIKITRFNGKELYINPHQIEFLEKTPDTIVTMFSDRKFVVTESPEEILERIVEYRKRIGLLGNETLF